MNENEAIQLWATLGAEGKSPTELTHASQVLPSYTVGIDPWIDRVAKRYLKSLCREAAHFKLILAPYGGGKTHFLLSLGGRGLAENFAVAYVPCSEGVGLDDSLVVYKEVVKRLQLPGRPQQGVRALVKAVVRSKRETIRKHGAPKVDVALRRWMSTIRRGDYPENAFGRVMSAALEAADTGDDSPLGDAALRWLQGDPDTLTKNEMQELRLARVPATSRKRFGRDLLLSAVKFLPEAGVHGLVLLMDEVETLFQARGRALLRILAAMRVILDVPTGVPGGVPLLGVFSATPDVLEEFRRYPALEQRMAVRGASFGEGNDLATQLPLEEVRNPETLLAEIGGKLIEVGTMATGCSFDNELQQANAQRLARVASQRSLDMDARRLFVKTWVGLLDLQSGKGEREFDFDELEDRYSGSFDSLMEIETGWYEP